MPAIHNYELCRYLLLNRGLRPDYMLYSPCYVWSSAYLDGGTSFGRLPVGAIVEWANVFLAEELREHHVE